MNLKKILATALSLMCITSVFTGCTTSTSGTADEQAQEEQANERATLEVQLNDYRGGVIRTTYLKDYVLRTMETMKSNNAIVRGDNPNSFWTTDGYQDFVVNFLSTPIIEDSQWFNEEETSWADVVTQISTTANTFSSGSAEEGYALQDGITITRNEKDDYSVTGVPLEASFGTNGVKIEGMADYRFLYDCDKDWCKAYATLSMESDYISDITPQMFEYVRVNNDTFAIQTTKERLLVVFAPVEGDTDFREREVKEFYYSKLTQDGMRTTFTPYEPLAEYDAITGEYDQDASVQNSTIQSYKVLNEDGDIAVAYGKHDSIFLTDDIAKEITSDWVFEDKSLQQAICYKDKCLVVTTYNKLSEKYERFTYAAESVKDSDITALEKLVEIEGLVGEQEIPVIEVPEVDPKDFADPTTNSTDTDAEEGTSEEESTEVNSEGEAEETSEESVDIPLEEVTNPDFEAMREQANNRKDGDVETS